MAVLKGRPGWLGGADGGGENAIRCAVRASAASRCRRRGRGDRLRVWRGTELDEREPRTADRIDAGGRIRAPLSRVHAAEPAGEAGAAPVWQFLSAHHR